MILCIQCDENPVAIVRGHEGKLCPSCFLAAVHRLLYSPRSRRQEISDINGYRQRQSLLRRRYRQRRQENE